MSRVRAHDKSAKRSTANKNVEMSAHSTELAKVQAQAQEYLAGWQRAQADYKNLQMRTQEQRAQVLAATTREIVQTLLPTLDLLDQVLSHKEAAAKDILTGTGMVAQQMLEALNGLGVVEITALGQPFDPALHEAVASVPGKKDTCVAEHARGYKLGDSVLRPSRVSVGNGVQKESKQ